MLSVDSWKDTVVKSHRFAASLDLVIKTVSAVRRLPLVEYHFVTHDDGTIFALRDDEVRDAFLAVKAGMALLYGIKHGTYAAAFDEQGCIVYASGQHEC